MKIHQQRKQEPIVKLTILWYVHGLNVLNHTKPSSLSTRILSFMLILACSSI